MIQYTIWKTEIEYHVDYLTLDLCGKPVQIPSTDVRGRWAEPLHHLDVSATHLHGGLDTTPQVRQESKYVVTVKVQGYSLV
jgi:hypothetical protein